MIQLEISNTRICFHDLNKTLQTAHQLVVYRSLLQNQVVNAALSAGILTSYPPVVSEINNAYHRFVHNLIMQKP